MQQNSSDQNSNEKKEYPFIREVIKPTHDRKKSILRIVQLIAGAVAAGLIAALVFVKAVPVADRLIGGGNAKKERVSVVTDSSVGDDSETSSADSGSSPETDGDQSEADGSGSTVSGSDSAETDTGSEKTAPADEPPSEGSGGETGTDPADGGGQEASPGTDAAGEDPAEVIREERDLVSEYRDLQKELNFIAVNSEKFLVKVKGIRSELDYFHDSYENEQEVSGILVAEDEENYYVLTEDSALTGAEQILVQVSGQKELEGSRIRGDANTGLAVVRVGRDQADESVQNALQIAQLGTSYTLGRGEPVIAVGSPMGYDGMAEAGTITSTGLELSLFDTHYHLFSTDITGSLSGSGVLVNLEGNVVGVIRQSLGSAGGTIVQALGISEISGLINSLSNDETRAYAGIRGDTVTQSISGRTGIPTGMLIQEVEADGPAMLAGLKQLDVIVRFGEKEITSVLDYTAALAESRAEQTVQITAMRKGAEAYEEMTFEVTLSGI